MHKHVSDMRCTSSNEGQHTNLPSARRVTSPSNAILGRAHQRIRAAMIDAHLPVTLCYVVHGHGFVAVGVDDAAPSLRRALDVLADGAPLRVFRCAPSVRHAKKREFNRPLSGGLYLNCPAESGEGTLCIAAKRDGKQGFVTCAHVVVSSDVDVYQPRQSKLNNWLAGQVKAVSDYRNHARSDSAFVASSTSMSPRLIWKSSDSSYTVDEVCDTPTCGAAVYMQGASNQSTLREGVICATNVTLTFCDGGVLSDQLLANYVSNEGDSGAPVFSIRDDPSVCLVGLNVGETKPEYVNPQPDPASWPPAKNGKYAVISPWTNVEQDLNVTLDFATVSP